MTVRRARRDDAAALWEVVTGPGGIRGARPLPFRSLDEMERRLAEPVPGARRLVAEVEGRLVGRLTLHVKRGRVAHRTGIGLMVHDAFQGRGIGTALMPPAVDRAERWLGLHRQELEVYPHNEPARRLYRRFEVEGEAALRPARRRLDGCPRHGAPVPVPRRSLRAAPRLPRRLVVGRDRAAARSPANGG